MVNSNDADRKLYLDILRAMATVGVIFIHVSSNNWYGGIGTSNWISYTVYNAIFRSSVPIFFMISGCLFLNSDKERSIKKIYLHYIGKLIVFLLFWSVIYKMVQFPDNEETFLTNVKSILIEIFKGDTQAHLWFVYAIIGLYILVPLLRPIVKESSREKLLYVIIVCFVLGNICELAGCLGWECLINNLNKIKSGISFGYIGYFLSGAYIDKYNITQKYRKAVYMLGVLGVALTIGLVLWDCISMQAPSERFWAYLMPNIYITSVAVFLWVRNFTLKENVICKLTSAISKRSLGIYGVHFLFIIILWRIGFTTYSFTGILSVPVISIIVFLMSYVASTLLGKIPIIGKYIA